jgi:hypothetical protein
MPDQFLRVELLGPVVGFIEILRHPFEPSTETHRPPAGGLVGGAAKKLGVHKTFHQEDGVPVSLLPVRGQAGLIERQHQAGQIGILAWRSQEAKTGIVGHQRRAGPPLIGIPADPLVMRPNMISRRRPTQ